ncbi:MAG: prepilin-type N-terminal cleavage/methylation domain-containing protein [Coxiellaceae bacterium]|nr:prepilin-type N-terminal cleavage/methylation domain-containing protein [Coxiellaceae bacterium]
MIRITHKIKGFTLVELITVIVILGVISAFAIPKFIDLKQKALFSTADNMFGSFRSAVNLAHSAWVAKGGPSSIKMQNQTIAMNSKGWPGKTNMDANYCKELWNTLLSSSVQLTEEWSQDDTKIRVVGNGDHCGYTSLDRSLYLLVYFPNRNGLIETHHF